MSHKKNRNYILFKSKSERYIADNGFISYKYIWTQTAYTRDELIRKLAITNEYENIKKNLVDSLDSINREYSYRWWHDIYFIGKKYTDETIKKVNIESLYNDVKINRENRKHKNEVNFIKYEREKNAMNRYQFRYNSVPGIHKSRYHRGDYYRLPKIHRLMKQSEIIDCDENIKISKKPEPLPLWYDDRVRHRDKCWKTSCKVKKQWQKNLPKHIDTEINKRYYENMNEYIELDAS